MATVYNFSAGPAVLPESVLQEAANEMMDYRATVVKKDRSLMNIPFVTGDAELDARFVKEAEAAGFVNLKGHRTVGGINWVQSIKDQPDVAKLVEKGKSKFAGHKIAGKSLGASTEESEDNCAKMAVRQVMDYLENGNIVNSVNFPNCDLGICTKASRITILHGDIPNCLSRFTSIVSAEGINISDMVNRSRGEYAYTMLDLDHVPSQAAIDMLQRIQGVFRVRVIK